MKCCIGRPKEKVKKSKTVHVRVYPEEYREVTRIARRAGTQPSKVVRQAISAIIRAQKPITERERNPDEFEAMVQAARNNPPLRELENGEFELIW